VSRPSGPPEDDGEAGEGRSGEDGDDGSPPVEWRGEGDAMAGADRPNPSSGVFPFPPFLALVVVGEYFGWAGGNLVWFCGGELVLRAFCFARELGRRLGWGGEVSATGGRAALGGF